MLLFKIFDRINMLFSQADEKSIAVACCHFNRRLTKRSPATAMRRPRKPIRLQNGTSRGRLTKGTPNASHMINAGVIVQNKHAPMIQRLLSVGSCTKTVCGLKLQQKPLTFCFRRRHVVNALSKPMASVANQLTLEMVASNQVIVIQ